MSFPLLFLPLWWRTGYSLSREIQGRSLYGKAAGRLLGMAPVLGCALRGACWGWVLRVLPLPPTVCEPTSFPPAPTNQKAEARGEKELAKASGKATLKPKQV